MISAWEVYLFTRLMRLRNIYAVEDAMSKEGR